MSISKITNAWYKLEFSFESCLIKEKIIILVLVTNKREWNLCKLGIFGDITNDPIRIDLLAIVALKKDWSINMA
jgi:hypothetical protein